MGLWYQPMLDPKKLNGPCMFADGFGEAGKPPLVGPDTTLHADLKLVSWKAVEQVTSDGGVIKKTLNDPSGYQSPSTDCELTLRYTGKLLDGTVFDEHREGNELHCLADDGEFTTT
jgi:hypothetical protein